MQRPARPEVLVLEVDEAARVRLELAREHLDRADGNDSDLLDPVSAFDAFARAAHQLQCWHDGRGRGPRPPGRLRRYQQPILPASTRLWATPLYRLVYDPDARPRRMRRRNLSEAAPTLCLYVVARTINSTPSVT